MSGVRNDGGYMRLGKKGDLTVYATYIQEQNNDPEISVMYIRNENRGNPDGGCRAYMIKESDLWIYRVEDRDRGKRHTIGQLWQRLANASIALYGFDVPAYRHRILDAVMEYTEDVIRLQPPPEMTWEQHRQKLAREGIRFTMRIDGKVVDSNA
jgi:hypothetical protein